MKYLYGIIVALSISHFVAGEVTMYYNLEATRVSTVQPLAEAVQAMSQNNSYLVSRVERAKEVVMAVQEENHRLKCSLAESTQLLLEEVEETNHLNDELGNFRWKVVCLEKVIERLTEKDTP